MERDIKHHAAHTFRSVFQPTLSVWRETIAVDSFGDFDDISTHSLRVERDQIVSEDSLQKAVFQPTLSVWRETRKALCYVDDWIFQPTLSVWRETSANWYPRFTARHFNPLSPCGERPGDATFEMTANIFQPTLSVWRETLNCIARSICFLISTHSLRVERDKNI